MLFDEFKEGQKIAVVSNITVRELKKAPEEVKEKLSEIPEQNIEFVSLTDDAEELARKYIEARIVSPKYLLDAEHIAIASIERVHILLSWNFKHIVNINRIRGYNSINLKYGYPTLEIRTPREVLDDAKKI